MLRLGGCYEKLGQEEARKVYERLIKEYPDQSREAGAARQRLASLVKTIETDPHKPTFRQIQIPTKIGRGGIYVCLQMGKKYLSPELPKASSG